MMRFVAILVMILVAILPALGLRGRKTFPATRESVAEENRRADSLGYQRYENLTEMERAVERRDLVYLTGLSVDKHLPANRRYCRPETFTFLQTLDDEFYQNTRKHLTIDSAVRPMEVQRHLLRINRNAAPATGERASSHERGTTIDLSRHISKRDYRFLMLRLLYYRGIGRILVIEERHCIHIFVGNVGVELEGYGISESIPAVVLANDSTQADSKIR